MFAIDKKDVLFVGWAFFFQIVLIIHFAIRKRFFESYTLKYGWIVYALCIPAALVSIILLLRKEQPAQGWSFWLGGFIFVVWAAFGFWVDYVKQIEWRTPLNYGVLLPYIFFYLATLMFYWWPLVLIDKRLWYIYGGLFVLSTILNLTSH